ncbi:MAG: bifunctional adenosylcobinamide kinase/adenosylcobinamide-phosphate guanylyltransferase [Oscillospiraceae bacterium]
MILIVGGTGQGKLQYVLKKAGLRLKDVAYNPADAAEKPIFAGLEGWLRTHPEETLERLLARNPGVIILCDEVGCGVVPIAPEERAYRETVGRLCCRLAEQAVGVERVFCGLAMCLKGETIWN